MHRVTIRASQTKHVNILFLMYKMQICIYIITAYISRVFGYALHLSLQLFIYVCFIKDSFSEPNPGGGVTPDLNFTKPDIL